MQNRSNLLKSTGLLLLTLAAATLFACKNSNDYSGSNIRTAVSNKPATEQAPATGKTAPGYYAGDNTSGESYARIEENTFHQAAQQRLSTFSIDVDAASYSNVRRFINGGGLPPADAVRVEEMINYFTYDYPQPDGDQPFSVNTDVARCPWDPTHYIALVGLQGRTMNVGQLPPSNLVFLVDVSGSMDEPDKLPLVQESLKMLTQQLRPQDRVAIVVYAGNAGLVLPSTSGADKAKILEAVDNLQAGGSTAGGEGILLAYKVAHDNFLPEGNNRVILATDGDFNVGVSDEAGLIKLIEHKRKEGVFLTVLGFGTGNLQDSKMEQLADKGNGHYAYIDTRNEAKKALVKELGATLFTIAKDVKIQVEFNPALVREYRLIGYENRRLNNEDFEDDTKDAGELGAGHSVTALYEIIPAAGAAPVRPAKELPTLDEPTRPATKGAAEFAPASFGAGQLFSVKLRYKEPKAETSKLIVGPAVLNDRATAGASDNLKFASAVAGWGMLLRDSKFKGSATFDQVLSLARGATGHDPEGYRQEFIGLVEASMRLKR